MPDVGLLKVKDPETGARVWADTSIKSVRDAYAKAWREQQEALEEMYNKTGMNHVSMRTDEDYVKILEEKTKNSDDNIFNLEAQISKEKIEINEKAKIQQILEKKKDGNKFRILCIEGGNIRSLIQILYLCEIENYIKKPISQAFDCIVTSKDGIFICGLLSAENEKKEIKYHANDILKIFNKQKETIYNSKLKKELKLNLLKKLIDIPEIFGNLFFFDAKSEAMIKIGSNDYIFDLFENYIDIPDEKDLKISLNQIFLVFRCAIKYV